MHVGDYVRTINGEIYKLINDFVLIYFQKEQEYGLPENQIIKSSQNIKSVIKEDDYVNGERVTRVIPEDICGDELLDYQHIFIGDKEIYEEDIKSIVTKERFESVKYKIGDDKNEED